MPETRFTEYTNHAFQLVKDIAKFAVETVEPAMLALRNDATRTNVKRDVTIYMAFVRITAWLRTFAKLNQTRDLQTICTGARCVFELHLDLVWFQKYPQQKWVDCYWEFSEVNQYATAEKIVTHRTQTPSSAIDLTPYQEAMSRLNTAKSVQLRVSETWGIKGKGNSKPKWPGHHWTGIGSLRERAEKVGPAYLDDYLQIYPNLSNFVHPGPAMFNQNFERLEMMAAFGYFHTFRHAHLASILACQLLSIERIDGFDQFKQQINDWLNQAMAVYPET